MTGVKHVAEPFEHPQDGKVFLASDVDAAEQLAALGPRPVGALRIFGGGDQVIFQKRRIVVGGLAHIFLKETLLVGATGLHPGEIFRLVHILTLVIGGQRLLEFPQETGVQRILKGDRVQANALGVAAFLHLADELVEEIVRPAVRGHQLHRTAPGDAGIGDRPQLPVVRVKRELVEDAPAALARLGVGVRTHRMNAAPVGKGQHIGCLVLVGVDHLFAEIARGDIHRLRPQLAILQKEPRLNIVARRHPLIVARALDGGAFVGRIGRRPGDTDLPRLLHQLQARIVPDPLRLEIEEDRAGIGGQDASPTHQACPVVSRLVIFLSVSGPTPALAPMSATASAAS